MKYLLCLILSFSISFLGWGQKDSLNNWIVKFNTTSIMSPIFPAIKMGFEKQFANNLSISGELGYQFTSLRNQSADSSFVKPYGFSGSAELRYYLKKNKKTKWSPRRYWAFNLFTMVEQYNIQINYIENGDTTFRTGGTDNLTVHKRKWGGNIIYGKQISLSKRWILDGYVGLGIRQKTIVNTHREFDAQKHEIFGNDLVPLFGYIDMRESSGINAHFTMGIRLGFILK